jgi:hypothetical protein
MGKHNFKHIELKLYNFKLIPRCRVGLASIDWITLSKHESATKMLLWLKKGSLDFAVTPD